MSIRILLGRAGSGKSERCLDEIRARLLERPDGNPLVLLVPEQATFQAEYALVSTPELSGMMRAQALSFRRLAFRVMQETGGTARVHIDESGKKMLLYNILHTCKEQLRLFHTSIDQMGFVEKLAELFNEFRRYGVSADLLEQQFGRLVAGHSEQLPLFAGKMQDVLFVYSRFEQELARLYVDSEDYLTMLAEQIAGSPFAASAEFWIDGFHGFTPQELRVIRELMSHSAGVSVAICADRLYRREDELDELDMFHPTARTMIRLNRLLEQLGLDWEETVLLGEPGERRFARSPMLAHLERHFGERNPAVYARNGEAGGAESVVAADDAADADGGAWNGEPAFPQISLNAAVTRRAEAEGVAREMIRLARDRGARWRDMAVMVRNYEEYGDVLATALEDYGIPHFFDQKRSVLHHPLIEFIRSALEVVCRNWRYEAVFRCVKSGFLPPCPADGGPDEGDVRLAMDRLENYVIAFGIQGSRWTDDKPWEYRYRMSLEDEDVPGSAEAEDGHVTEMNRWREVVAGPLRLFHKAMRKAKSVRDMAGGLYELLERVGAPRRLELWSERYAALGRPEKAREHTQIWGQVVDLLDQIVEMMGEQTLPVELFANVVETGLESIRLGLVPPAMDQVLIGSMDRTRPSRIRYCFVLGASDGVMPAAMSESGVLTECERERLAESGLELADGSRRKLLDEQFLMYTAFMTPSDYLWISYPLADGEGKTLLPSEIIRQLMRMFPHMKETALLAEPAAGSPAEAQLDYVAKPERALSYMTNQLREWKRGSAIDPLWWEVYNWYGTQDVWRDALRRAVGSIFYANRAAPLGPETGRLLYGDVLRASVSRMERFVACPFSQFVSHGLRLTERQVFRLDAPDIGQLFHAALSMFADQLLRDNVNWGDLSEEQCRARAAAIVDKLAPRLQGEILLSSQRYHYILRKLTSIIGRAAAVLGAQAKYGQFSPVGLELGFGPGQTLPPLAFQLDNGSKMEIVGRIDRVDRADADQGTLLRVIDYKSSRTSLSLTEVYYGLSLQVLTYLDVVITHAERWLGEQSKPAGVLYFHVHNPLLQTSNALDAHKAEELLFKQFKMRGLLMADPEIVRLMDGSLRERSGFSDVLPVGLKTDGGFYKNSSAIEPRDWDALNRHVRRSIQKIGTDITSGKTDIRPYRLGLKSPCAFCSYKPVCQFDRLIDGNEYQYMEPMSKDEVMRRITGRASDAEHDA